MAFVTKTWKDRLVEYAGRRKLKNVATGEEVLMDVSRSEGTVSQAGDAFSAANMNNLEQRIKKEFDTVNSSLNWKLIGTATGTQSIAVDSTKYNELNVIVCTGAHACYSFSIPSIYLDETIFNFVNGYFAYDNYRGMITLSADKTKIMLESVWKGGQNISNTCITKVYAR